MSKGQSAGTEGGKSSAGRTYAQFWEAPEKLWKSVEMTEREIQSIMVCLLPIPIARADKRIDRWRCVDYINYSNRMFLERMRESGTGDGAPQMISRMLPWLTSVRQFSPADS